MNKKSTKRIIIIFIVLLALFAGAYYLRKKHAQPVNEEAIKKNADSTANSKLNDLNKMFEEEQDTLR